MIPKSILAQGGHSFGHLFEICLEPSIRPLRAFIPSFTGFRVCFFPTLFTIWHLQFSGVFQHPTADNFPFSDSTFRQQLLQHTFSSHVFSNLPATGQRAIANWHTWVQGQTSDPSAIFGTSQCFVVLVFVRGIWLHLVSIAFVLRSDTYFLASTIRSFGPSCCNSIWTSSWLTFW